MYKVITGGCNSKHPHTYKMSRPNGLTNYVLLIIRTSGCFDIAGESYAVTPGQALIIAPNTPYSYGNPDGEYIDDWLHFMPDFPYEFEKRYPIINAPFPIGNTELFTFLIRQALWESNYTLPEYSSENADALLTVLFNHLLSSRHEDKSNNSSKPYQKQLRQIRLELQNDFSTEHTIEYYAKKLGISSSYFQHLYTELFGISFGQDMIHFRTRHAAFLLTTTDLTLEQIAEICGYNNEVHFYRQFKQIMSITPARYRRSVSLNK